MASLTLGVSHRHATVELLDRLAFTEDDLATLWVGTEENMQLRGPARDTMNQGPFAGGPVDMEASPGAGETRGGGVTQIQTTPEVEADRRQREAEPPPEPEPIPEEVEPPPGTVVPPATEGPLLKEGGAVNTVFLASDTGGGGEIVVGLSRIGAPEGYR